MERYFKMDPKETVREVWIGFIYFSAQWRALVNTVTDLRVL